MTAPAPALPGRPRRDAEQAPAVPAGSGIFADDRVLLQGGGMGEHRHSVEQDEPVTCEAGERAPGILNRLKEKDL